MEKFSFVAMTVLLFIGRMALLLLQATGYTLFTVTRPVFEGAVRMLTASPDVRAARPASAARVNAEPVAETAEAFRDTGPPTIFMNDFPVADRIVSMRLEPPVGVINLRVYHAQRLVKRDLIISEPRLKQLMGGRRHTFPDATYEPRDGMDHIKDESIELAERLINDVGNQSVKGRKPRKDDFVRSSSRPASAPPAKAASTSVTAALVPVPTAAAAPPVQASTVPLPAASHLQTPSEPAKVATVEVREGFTYVGQLVKAESSRIVPQGRPAYDVFEATLRLDNNAEMSLRGAELERELSSTGCIVGSRVAITPMGKVPVTLGNGGEGKKNLYRVQRMGAPQAA